MNLKNIALALLSTNFLSVVSAYSFGSFGRGYYGSPMDLLDNEWVRIAAIFVLFFAIIFFAISKTFKENKGVAVAISLAISFFIAVAVQKQGWIYSYAGDEIGSWALVVAILLIIGFIIKLMNDVFGRFGAIIAVIIIWVSLFFIDIYAILPYGELGDFILEIYNYAKGVVGFFVLIVVIALLYKYGKKKKSALKELLKEV